MNKGSGRGILMGFTGGRLTDYIKDHIIYYAGPVKTPHGSRDFMMTVEDFPGFIIVDDKGNDFYSNLL
jgi:tartrate dehydratase beta subunit/fumarate hydratase class I family protein